MVDIAEASGLLTDFHPFGQAFRQDPPRYYTALQAASPLPIDVEGKPAVVVARYRQAKSMLSFYKQFSSVKPPGTPGMERVDFFNSRPVMNYSDPPEHTQLRKIVAPSFSPRALEVLKVRAQAIADELLDGLGSEFDGVANLGYPFSMRLLLNSFMGVPKDEEHVFTDYLSTIPLLDQIPPGGGKPQAYLDAWRRGAEYCDVALDRARKDKTDNIVRLIADASDDGTISKDDVMATMVVLFAGGLTTVAATVGTTLLKLAENPDVADRIRQDLNLATRHFEETLRLFPAVAQVMRFPTQDLAFEGLAIEKYTPIYIILAAACHDPEEFPEPYGFDIDRPNNKDHLAFSAGIHTCIGNVIARAVMPPLIANVARRFPGLHRADPDAPLAFDHGNPRVRHLTSIGRLPDRMAAFDNKVVVVTGAAGGIGSAISTRFASEGAHVISVDKNEEWLTLLHDAMAQRDLATELLPLDCSDYDAVQNAHAAIIAAHGRVDILINNCGQSARQKQTDFTDSDPAIWDFLIDTNLRTTLNWSRAVAPGMRERQSGKIVNIASESAIYGDPKLVDYAAVKGGVIGFTRGLARELAPFGINVNAVSPGVTRTRAVIDGVPQHIVDAAMAQIPRGRMCEPEDMAAVIRFLASEDAIGIVGQNIIVSGGRTMQ